ncbi:hypothetical protein CIB48_g1659 [Xylaria polymorpha]|nr:hypothetical protein CIB48_g1659 [Xylaria polymorpha]
MMPTERCEHDIDGPRQRLRLDGEPHGCLVQQLDHSRHTARCTLQNHSHEHTSVPESEWTGREKMAQGSG